MPKARACWYRPQHIAIIIGITIFDIAAGEIRAVQDPPVTWRRLSSDSGELPVPPANNGQSGLRVIDLDNDGQTDYVVTLWGGPAVVWYRRSGTSFQEYIIEPQTLDLSHGEKFKDIDGDGDIDLIFGQASGGNGIYWWENPRPNYAPGTPWVRRTVRDEGGNFYHDNIWGDFDDDGKDEFIAWNQYGLQLLLFEVPADPKNTSPWPATTIFSWVDDPFQYRGTDTADIDGDGKVDFVGGGGWFKHQGGTNFAFNPIDPAAGYTQIKAGQLISGGRPEVVCLFELQNGPLKMYEWTGSNWQAQTILSSLRRSHTLQIGDVNLDGHPDIVVAEMGQPALGGTVQPGALILVLYGDGAGNFVQQIVHVGQGLLEGQLADVDDDGDLDIVGSSFVHNAPRMDMWINDGFGPEIIPHGGTHIGQVTVGLSAVAGDAIHYTTDGSNPTAASPSYTGPFTINNSTTVKAAAADNGTIIGSSQAGFVIQPDLSPPLAVAASAATDPTQVRILFSEPVTQATAESIAHYAVSHGVTVSSAVLGDSLSSVVLTTTPLSEDVDYTVIINNVTDRSANANMIAPNSLLKLEFTPLPTQDLALWLRADAGTVLHGTMLTRWDDQSGNDRHAVPTAPFSRPSLTGAALNGQPAVGFDGVNDYLSFDLPVNGLTGVSLFLVAANAQDQALGLSHHASNAAVFWDETAAWGTVYLTPFQSEVHLRFGTTQTGTEMTYLRPASVGDAFTRTAAIKDGTTDRVYVDGDLVLSEGGRLSTLADNRDTGNLGFGYPGNTYFAGSIAEVLVFTRAVGESERNQIEDYLVSRHFTSHVPTGPADFDLDADVDTDDWQQFEDCASGPAVPHDGGATCQMADFDTDGDVDHQDFSVFQQFFGCTGEACVEADLCPDDPAKTLPGPCGCGNPDTDSDGDTVADCIDACDSDPNKINPGACGCGTPDDDADADGTPDCIDACPDDPAKIEPGQCGCGNPDTDTDGDGTAVCNDACDSDPAKTEPGQCGCGAAEDAGDDDGDAVINCLDQCPESSPGQSVGPDGCPEINVILTEDFEGYSPGDDPADWLDTGANNSLAEDDSLFEVIDLGGNKVYTTSSTALNIHAHYVGTGSDDWTDYTFTGRMMITGGGGIGVTFLSNYADADWYYRLRAWGGGSFQINPHGTSITSGTSDTGLIPTFNTWYRFRIEVVDTGSATEIRAKVWEDGAAEPGSWQIDCLDSSGSRRTRGTIGFWCMSTGNKHWDDLEVTSAARPG